MRHPLQSGCTRSLIASILASALCAAAPASAEIFKCFAKDRTPIYQNFPCQFDSNPQASLQVSPQVNPQIAKTAFVAPVPKEVKPKAPPANVAPPVQPTDPTEPRIGMPESEIRSLLGEPLEIVQDEPTPGIATWRYVNRSVQFDSNQVVVEMQSW
jgi:hypothetical protein